MPIDSGSTQGMAPLGATTVALDQVARQSEIGKMVFAALWTSYPEPRASKDWALGQIVAARGSI